MSEGEEELNVGAVRLEEVASAANVSLSTASKALRGKPHVSEKTRIRVIDAAQSLGYSAAEAMASMARLASGILTACRIFALASLALI